MEGMHRPATATLLQSALHIFVGFNMLSVICATYQRYKEHIKLLLRRREIAFRERFGEEHPWSIGFLLWSWEEAAEEELPAVS